MVLSTPLPYHIQHQDQDFDNMESQSAWKPRLEYRKTSNTEATTSKWWGWLEWEF